MTKVVLVNDTSLYSTHFGCQLVGQVFREQFKRIGFDLVLSLPKIFDLGVWRDHLARADVVVVNGEGSIHHGRNLHLLELAETYATALMNCVYQDNPDVAAVKKLVYVSARESLSAGDLVRQGVACEVVPDVLFASSFVRSFPVSTQTNELCVTDNVVGKRRRFGPLRLRDRADIDALDRTPAQYLSELSSYKAVCAGRFHAAVVSSILGIPFSTWESNTWKTRGMMDDMGVPHLHFPDRESALKHVPVELDPRIPQYAKAARSKVEGSFDRLKDAIAG